jgi:CRP-like cAMP-binding protein
MFESPAPSPGDPRPEPTSPRDEAAALSVEDLRLFPLFGEVTDDELRPMLTFTEMVTRAAGQDLFFDFDEVDALYLVMAGAVKIHIVSIAPPSDVPLGRVFPGELIGELGLFGVGTRTAAATAEVDTTLLRIELGAMIGYLLEFPDLRARILYAAGRVVADRLRRGNRRMVNIYRASV